MVVSYSVASGVCSGDGVCCDMAGGGILCGIATE